MRLTTAILLFSSCTTTFAAAQDARPARPRPVPEATPSITVDTDGDGLPDSRLERPGDEFTRPFGFTSFGLTSFSDTDGDGLPDTRLERPGYGVVPVNHVDLDDLAQRLGVLFQRIGPAPILVPHPASGQLIVGGSTRQLEMVRSLVKILDVRPAKAVPATDRRGRWSGAGMGSAAGAGTIEDLPKAKAQPAFDVTVENGFVSLTVRDPEGGSVDEFLQLSQRLIGLPVVFDAREVGAQNTRIQFRGTMRVPEENYLDLFQSLLFSNNYGIIERGGEKFSHLELVYLNGPRRTQVTAGARMVAEDELQQYANRQGVQIQTIVQFEHIRAMVAANQLRPFFAMQGSQATQLVTAPVGEDSSALLVQGFAPQVVQAHRLLRAADRAAGQDPIETMIVRLEHRNANEIGSLLNQMFQQLPQVGAPMPVSRFRVVADPGTNSLVLTGSQAELRRSSAVVAQLDVSIKKD